MHRLYAHLDQWQPLAWALCCLLGGSSTVLSAAKPVELPPVVFTWVGADGSVHLTDRLDAVPQPYRSMYAARLERLVRQLQESAAKTPLNALAHISEGSEDSGAPKPAASQRRTRPSQPAHSSTGGQSYLSKLENQRLQWQLRLKLARQQLAQLTAQYARLDTEISQLTMNAQLAALPAKRQRLAQLRGQKPTLLEKLRQAERELNVTLPAQGRREGIPPAWLR